MIIYTIAIIITLVMLHIDCFICILTGKYYVEISVLSPIVYVCGGFNSGSMLWFYVLHENKSFYNNCLYVSSQVLTLILSMTLYGLECHRSELLNHTLIFSSLNIIPSLFIVNYATMQGV